MPTYFAPGCGYRGYQPERVEKMAEFLRSRGLIDGVHTTCCHFDLNATEPTTVINICPGCDRRFRTLYENVTTVSLWEVLLDTDYPFPDYHGMKMSVHDACPTRNQPQIHEAVRAVLRRMNIEIVEAERSRENSRCCGSSYFDDNGCSAEEAVERAQERVSDFPCEDVAVYCVGCGRYLRLGGAKPHHLMDLLLSEPTTIPPKPVFEIRAQEKK